jgi:hypothetical protein
VFLFTFIYFILLRNSGRGPEFLFFPFALVVEFLGSPGQSRWLVFHVFFAKFVGEGFFHYTITAELHVTVFIPE